MYNLYFNRKDKTIKLQKVKRLLTAEPYPEKPKRYNDCYWICAHRQPLKEIGSRMKEKWVEELEEKLEKIRNIKI